MSREAPAAAFVQLIFSAVRLVCLHLCSVWGLFPSFLQSWGFCVWCWLTSSPLNGDFGVATVGPQDRLAQCQVFGLLYNLIQERQWKVKVTLSCDSLSLRPSAALYPILQAGAASRNLLMQLEEPGSVGFVQRAYPRLRPQQCFWQAGECSRSECAC